jgi:hypothetical protein
MEITVYTWHLCFALPPGTLRIANFTYTVLSSLAERRETVTNLSFLEGSIRQATFSGMQPARTQ